jgi:hypothetical protein
MHGENCMEDKVNSKFILLHTRNFLPGNEETGIVVSVDENLDEMQKKEEIPKKNPKKIPIKISDSMDNLVEQIRCLVRTAENENEKHILRFSYDHPEFEHDSNLYCYLKEFPNVRLKPVQVLQGFKIFRSKISRTRTKYGINIYKNTLTEDNARIHSLWKIKRKMNRLTLLPVTIIEELLNNNSH